METALSGVLTSTSLLLAEGGDVGVAGVGHAEAAIHAQRRGLQGGKARGGQQPGAGPEALMGESVLKRQAHAPSKSAPQGLAD